MSRLPCWFCQRGLIKIVTTFGHLPVVLGFYTKLDGFHITSQMSVEGLHSLDVVTPTPMRRISSKDDDQNCFFSSILSVAQNAATIMSTKQKEEESNGNIKFNLQISPYQSQHDLPLLNIKATTPITNEANSRSAATEIDSSQSQLLTSIVHFELVRDSPANTLGDGNLTLSHFDRKLTGSTRPQIVISDSHTGESSTAVLMANEGEQKVTRGRSGSRATVNGSLDDGKDVAELTLSELENILDSASVAEASSKKNREFHAAFRSVPSSERLISDYSCALSKDILVQGKLYLSQNFLFFKSNILGWVTNILIPLQEVIQIEKKSTAVLFPNGIVIRTLHQKYVFASFITRDATFNCITKVWHNVLQNSVIDVSSTKGKSKVLSRGRLRSFRETDKEISSASDTSSEMDDELDSIVGTDEESENEPEEQHTPGKSVTNKEASNRGSDSQSTKIEEQSSSSLDEREREKGDGLPSRKGSSKFGGIFNPGPQTHEPTSNGYVKEANDVEIIEHLFKAPLGVIFTILFGSDNSHFVKILKAQKNFDIEDSKITELSEAKDTRNYSYTKPLNASIGPKQTRCLVTDTLKSCDFSKSVQVEQVTSSPDVPSGNSFKVLTKFLLSWDKNNSTKMKVVTSVEWSARSWIKGPVEKGSIDGQKDFMKGLVTIVTNIISSGDSGEKSKSKRRKSKSISRSQSTKEEIQEPPKETSFVERITSLLEGIGDHVQMQAKVFDNTILGAIVIVGLCVCYSLFIMWAFGSRSQRLTFDANFDDVGTKVVCINNKKFYLQPTLDSYLKNRKRRAISEHSMWNSVSGKDLTDLNNGNEAAQTYANEEFQEVVKLARDRMEHVYKKLNI